MNDNLIFCPTCRGLGVMLTSITFMEGGVVPCPNCAGRGIIEIIVDQKSSTTKLQDSKSPKDENLSNLHKKNESAETALKKILEIVFEDAVAEVKIERGGDTIKVGDTHYLDMDRYIPGLTDINENESEKKEYPGKIEKEEKAEISMDLFFRYILKEIRLEYPSELIDEVVSILKNEYGFYDILAKTSLSYKGDYIDGFWKFPYPKEKFDKLSFADKRAWRISRNAK